MESCTSTKRRAELHRGNWKGRYKINQELAGGFKYFLLSSLFGDMIQFDSYFSKGLVQPPTRKNIFSGTARDEHLGAAWMTIFPILNDDFFLHES